LTSIGAVLEEQEVESTVQIPSSHGSIFEESKNTVKRFLGFKKESSRQPLCICCFCVCACSV
jgi:hypothetical protein